MNEYFKPLKKLPNIIIIVIGIISGIITINGCIKSNISGKNIESKFIICCWLILIFFLIALVYIIGYVYKVNDIEKKFPIVEVINDDSNLIILKNNESIGISDFVKFIEIKPFSNTTIGYGFCYDVDRYTQINPLFATKGNEDVYRKLLENNANTKATIKVQKKIIKEDYDLIKNFLVPIQGGN